MPTPASVTHLVAPDQDSAFSDVILLTRRQLRDGCAVTLVGPISRHWQEQLESLRGRWVNLPLPPGTDLGQWRQIAGQFRRLVRSSRPELVHSHGLWPALAAAYALRGLADAPRLVISLPDLGTHHLTSLQRWLLRQAVRRADCVIASTRTDLGTLQDLDAAMLQRAVVIPQAIEVRPTRGDFDVGMKRRALGVSPQTAVVGVISPAVLGLGLETFLSAAREVAEAIPNVEFLVVGDGPDLEELKLLAHNLGIGGSVVFRGARTDIPEIIGSLNLLVIPHEVPGAARYALQAVAQEIPVVAADSPALAEVLADLAPASLVGMDEAGALTEAISRELEVPPPPAMGDEVFLEGGISLSYSDLLVAREEYDLDTAGLEAEGQYEAPHHRAARIAVERFSPASMIAATERAYARAMAPEDSTVAT